MKKNTLLLASAALGMAAGQPVLAQSDVALYGLIDVGIERLDHAGAGGGLARVIGANMAGSRWGLRGVEELGGGLRAIFNLEGGFRPDTGVTEQGGRLFGRVAVAGLQGAMGTLTLGRQAIVLNDVMFQYDPMGYALYSAATLDGKFFGRSDNAVKYVSPAFGGLVLSGHYSFGFDNAFVPSQGEVAGNARVGRAAGLAANYRAGPLGVGLVYDRLHSGVAAKADAGDKDQRLLLASQYQLDAATVFAGARALKSDIAGTAGLRSTYLWAGLGWRTGGAMKLTAAAYRNAVRDTAAHPLLTVLNADYYLSKRTDVYASVARMRNSGGAAGGSSAGVTGGGEAIATGAPGVDQTGIVAGIRHRF